MASLYGSARPWTKARISTDAVTQRTFTGSGSAPTAQMEPLYRSGQQEVHQHYWPEERGVAARLCELAFGTYFPAGVILVRILTAPEPTDRAACCPLRVCKPTAPTARTWEQASQAATRDAIPEV